MVFYFKENLRIFSDRSVNGLAPSQTETTTTTIVPTTVTEDVML